MSLSETEVYGMGVDAKIRRIMNVKDKALSGDIVWRVSPATVAPAPTTEAWTRIVQVYLETAAGELHTWFSDAIATGNSIADTGGGTASIVSTTLTVVRGRATVVVSGTEATWANAETDTYTVTEATILGYTIAAKTSVETFTT